MILKKVIGSSLLTFEELTTFLTQIEATLNQRPLTPLSEDPNDLEALTPAHFLSGPSTSNLPEIDNQQANLSINLSARWKHIQELKKYSFCVGKKEYVINLQKRGKWKSAKPNVKIGDLVLIMEQSISSSSWILGKGLLRRPVNKVAVLPVQSDLTLTTGPAGSMERDQIRKRWRNGEEDESGGEERQPEHSRGAGPSAIISEVVRDRGYIESLSPGLTSQRSDQDSEVQSDTNDGKSLERLRSLDPEAMREEGPVLRRNPPRARRPPTWKHAIIITIPKKSPAKSPEDLRPISLLSSIGKVYERIVLRRLQTYMDSINFIIPQQFGFRNGHSTTHQLITVIDYIQIRKSHKEAVGAVFLDFTKAFDRNLPSDKYRSSIQPIKQDTEGGLEPTRSRRTIPSNEKPRELMRKISDSKLDSRQATRLEARRAQLQLQPRIMSKNKKRTLKDENRLFNEEWELQYFLISSKDKMVCLLCSTVLTTIKKYNANQHYMTHSNHKYAILEGEARKTILQQLKNEKLHRQQTFNRFFQQNNNATEATYKVAYILGKRGKPFSDVEMIKECIVEVVKCLHPEKVDKYKQLPLSRGIITERQHELATNIKQQFCKDY
ncbi:EPM2AIP1 [Cordylochernes scorpioides]|uniref:EPM2AIP1 n=1 Tax=Cordylochernes scorpioides TaxID=51811 RepID=A0ABY6KFX6_9ARAC|nr:EPM2AIP1 [Cordylochernes scorpioides]